MSDGYDVVMEDVLSMARTFGAESKTLSGAVRAAGVSAPDGGDGVINAALSNVLKAAGMATGQLAAVIGSHSDKLNSAYKTYLDTEQSNTQLCQDLTRLITGG